MVKSLNIAAQNVTSVAALAAAGRGTTLADFTQMGLSDLLNVEMRPASYSGLDLRELLDTPLDAADIPGIGTAGFDPIRLASTDLPDDLTLLSLRDLMNIGVSAHAIVQDALPEVDSGDVTVSGPNVPNRDHQSDSPGNPAQGGGSSFQVADLAALVEDLAPEELPPLNLDEEEGGHAAVANYFTSLVSPESQVAAEVISGLFKSEDDGSEETAGAASQEDDAGTATEEDAAGSTLVGTNGNDFLLGGAGDDSLHGKNGDDVLDGGGGRDKLWGGNGDDVLRWDESDFLISGGNGTDTLRIFTGEVEFDDFAGHISGIEQVDLASDPGANELELSAQDVLDLSDDNILTVFGGSGDSADAGSGWNDAGLDGEGYHVYTQMVGGQLATLRLDDEIPVNADILA